MILRELRIRCGNKIDKLINLKFKRRLSRKFGFEKYNYWSNLVYGNLIIINSYIFNNRL